MLIKWVFEFDPLACPWTKADWAQPKGQFDPHLLSRNSRDCFMREHHIQVHYMTKEQFESLGIRPDPQNMPFTTNWRAP